MQLQDKVIVVTGGGRGIGKALCQRFAQENPSTIVVVDLDLECANRVSQEMGGIALPCDVGNESQIQSVVERIEARYGRIDLFCANAGIAITGGIEIENSEWNRVMNVNFMSHVYSARAVMPGMLSRGEGYFLHTASAAGLLTQIGSAPYAVSKHAAVAFAEWLAITYGDQGIRVSCLCPQGVLTDMLDGDDRVLKSLRANALSPDQVADCVVDGIQAERFLILPHLEVGQYFQNKAGDYDRWIGGMKKLQRSLAD